MATAPNVCPCCGVICTDPIPPEDLERARKFLEAEGLLKGERLTTYEEFVAAMNRRPADQSPLMWMVGLDPRPPQASEWMLRWLRKNRMDEVKSAWKRERAENVALRRQLNEQWDYNHAEHCGCEDPDGKRCQWPLPVLLGGDPDRYRTYQDEQATEPRFPIDGAA